jgi:predicted CopG family antitoxin
VTTKTISIDLEAYGRLKKARINGESFSEVIKREVREPLDVQKWLKSVRAHTLSDAAIGAVEELVAGRRRRSRRGR